MQTPDNFYLYWDGAGLRSENSLQQLQHRPHLKFRNHSLNADTQEFYNAELSTWYEADANIITPAMSTANNEILVLMVQAFENRTECNSQVCQ